MQPNNPNHNPTPDLSSLYEKYKNNPYILNRLQIYLTNLPNILEAENKKYEERILRINDLTIEHDNFHKVFLSKHQYYYMPYNNLYYEYDGKTYRIVKDDDIHHNLLSTITDEGKLITWKHKTKQNIIRTIKERNLFKSLPETYTIQNVLSFLNTIFETKTESKYFLTVIGDCILKKTVSISGNETHTQTQIQINGLMFHVNSNLKKLISFIDSIAYITTGNSIMNNFISKYHDSHDVTSYRLIKTNDNVISGEIIKDILNKIGLDLLCVATHYSERYTNSDKFLNTKAEDNIRKYAMFFLINNLDKIIGDFVSQYIEQVTNLDGQTQQQLETIVSTISQATQPIQPIQPSQVNRLTNLSWKNMHYIWKLYLSNNKIPNMIYVNNLKSILKNKLQYNEDGSDIIFINVTSKFLPNVSNFLSFWEKHITISCDTIFDEEYEIDELYTLYKLSNKDKDKEKEKEKNVNINISDKEIIKIIRHYFSPSVEIIDNKYITNIKCNLWSKYDDIIDFLKNYQMQKKITTNNTNNTNNELISFDELYKNYNSFYNAKIVVDKLFYPIVSKNFFEKFLQYFLSDYIKFEKFISSEWCIQ